MNTIVWTLFDELAYQADKTLEKIRKWINVFTASNAFETDIAELIFNATTLADLAENDTTTPATSLHVSLHTGDPGEAGNQTTSEAAYGAYARQAVARTSGGWTVSGNNTSNTAAISFPEATSGSETETYFGIGVDISGVGYLICSGALTASLAVSTGITPNFAIGACDVDID